MELLSKFNEDGFKEDLEKQGLSKGSIEQYVYGTKAWLKFMEKFDNLNEEQFLEKMYEFFNARKREWNMRFGVKLYLVFIGKKDIYDKFYVKYRRKFKMLARRLPKKSISVNDIILVAEHIKVPYKFMFLIQYETALRFCDVNNIKFGDFSTDENRIVYLSIKEQKTGKLMTYILSDKLGWILAKYIKIKKFEEADKLFNVNREAYNYNIKIACKEAGLENWNDISSHWIRTSRAVHLARKGYDIFTVKKLLGHKSIRTTEIYLQEAGIDLKDLLQKETMRWKLI